jgi:ATP-dependent DNA ligase
VGPWDPGTWKLRKPTMPATPKINTQPFPEIDLPITPPYAPMEAKRLSALPKGDTWQFEPKWDGFRAIVFRKGDVVAIQSKAGQPLGRYFPELVEAFLRLRAKEFVLDGEIVVPVGGRLSFDDLLQRIHPAESRIRKLAESAPAQYYAFDLLYAKRKLLATEPIEERRARLEEFFESVADPQVRLSPATTDRKLAGDWFNRFGAAGLDGVIAKKLGEPYHSGDREGMVKVKHLKTADCVVGGFRYGEGTKVIGSLLLGLYDGEADGPTRPDAEARVDARGESVRGARSRRAEPVVERKELRVGAGPPRAGLRGRVRLLLAGSFPARLEVPALASREASRAVHDGSGAAGEAGRQNRDIAPRP